MDDEIGMIRHDLHCICSMYCWAFGYVLLTPGDREWSIREHIYAVYDFDLLIDLASNLAHTCCSSREASMEGVAATPP